MDNTKISIWEFVCLTSVVTFTPLLVTLPRIAAEAFGTGALVHAVYIGILIALYFWLILKIYKNQEDKDLFDLAENVGGKWLKIIVGIIVITYLLTTAFITINEFSEDVKNVLFDDNSIQTVNIFFILAISIST